MHLNQWQKRQIKELWQLRITGAIISQMMGIHRHWVYQEIHWLTRNEVQQHSLQTIMEISHHAKARTKQNIDSTRVDTA